MVLVFKIIILKCEDLPGTIEILFTHKPQYNSANCKTFMELFEGNAHDINHDQPPIFKLVDIWPNVLHHYSSVKCYLCFAFLISNWFSFSLLKLGQSQSKVYVSKQYTEMLQVN